MIVGRKVTKSYLNKLDRYHVVLSATLKIQYFIKKHFLLKSDIKSQVSLRCLKLIEKLAKINRTRMIKMFKKLRRFSKKLKKLDSRA